MPAVHQPTAAEKRHGLLWMAVSALFFGAMATATSAVAHGDGLAGPQIAFVRFAVGFAAVLLTLLVRRDLFQATRFSGLALRGIFGGGAVLGYFIAIERLGAGVGTLLNYTFPLWAAVFGAAFLRERLAPRVLLGMAVATVGLGIVVGPGEVARVFSGLGDPAVSLGFAAGLTSSFLGGAATTVMRVLRRTESALAIFGAFCAIGMLVCLPSAIAEWKPISVHAALLLLLVGALSYVAQVLYTYSLKFVSSGGSLITQLTVVSSFALAGLFLGEPVALHQALGGLVVMAGVLVVSLAK